MLFLKYIPNKVLYNGGHSGMPLFVIYFGKLPIEQIFVMDIRKMTFYVMKTTYVCQLGMGILFRSYVLYP